jgi:hypothetical protein
MTIVYDQMAKDLARKCADDVRSAMWRTVLLAENDGQRGAIAMMGAANANAITAAIFARLIGSDNPEAVAEALWEQMRPMLISAIASAKDHTA